LEIIYKSNQEAKQRKLGFGKREYLIQKRSASCTFNLMKDRVSKESSASALFSEVRVENVP
jgi:hypothetical protein